MAEEYSASLHKFTVDFLGAPVTISIGKTFIDALGKVSPDLVQGEGPNTKGMTIEGTEEGYCIIVLPEDADINTIVHESMHCVNYLIHFFGLPHNPEDDELMAYLMGYVVDCVTDALGVHAKLEEESKEHKSKKKREAKNG